MTPSTLSPSGSGARGAARSAFTLIEILAVISIIVILIGLITGVGVGVIRKQEVTQTRSVLHTLDRALDEFIQQSGAAPAYSLQEYEQRPGPNVQVSDNNFFRPYPVGGQLYPVRPDASVFVKQAETSGNVSSIIKSIGESFLVPTLTTEGSSSINDRDGEVVPSIVDTWARDDWQAPWDPALPVSAGSSAGLTQQQLIYYVHPENRLAQELYGKCVNGRPYFFSAGPDQQYGLRSEFGASADQATVESALDDNVYSYEVKPANRSENFFRDHR